MDNLNRYLKYGTTSEFTYGEPISIIDIEWEEAKEEFRKNLIKSISKFKTDGVAFCGTMSACCMLQLTEKNMSTWSVDIGIDTKTSSDLFKSKNHTVKIKNLEKSIIEINKINPFLRSSIEDIYAYTRQKFWSKYSKNGLCEGGTDYLLSTNNDLMYLAILRKEYSILKALKITSPNKIKNIKYISSNMYSECFNNAISIFNNDDLIDLGLEPISIELKEDRLDHYTKAMFDWGYKTVYEQRTKVFMKYFDFKTFSPYVNDIEMVNFCLSLPMEMKFCLGRGKHILKEAIPVVKNHLTNRIFPNIYETIKPEFEVLIDKYLKNKKRKIFSYLPYNKVQKYLNGGFLKKWILLNLAIWMEIN